MVELYIYYQVSDANAARLLPVVRAMQASLASGHAVGTSLKRRPGSEQGLQTWMEIYTDADAGFSATLDAAVAAVGIPQLLQGARHTEVFTEMPPCA
jgi:hypothetical protein